jgi:hypothetical protein
MLGLIEVTRLDNKTNIDPNLRRSGSVGVYVQISFKKFDKDKKIKKCYCLTGDKLNWWIQKNMPSREAFGEPDWESYKTNKDKDWITRYFANPVTYEGLDLHESTHVKQFESIAEQIQKELEEKASEKFGKEICYETEKSRDDALDAVNKKYANAAPTAIKAFEDKYGKGGLDLRDLKNNKAEQEAVEAEWRLYEEQFNKK